MRKTSRQLSLNFEKRKHRRARRKRPASGGVPHRARPEHKARHPVHVTLRAGRGLPSLREHPEDIPDLAEHFTARHAKNCNRGVMGISEQAMACLTQYDWPGNIRELENALERAVVIGSSNKILAEDLPETLLENAKGGSGAPAKYHEAIRNLKKQMILGALEQAGGNVTEAAKLLGVHGNYLHRLMRNFELRSPVKKQTSA